MRLAGCSFAAFANTQDAVKDRIAPGHPFYSASYGDVCAAVDREMFHREQARAERQKVTVLYQELLGEPDIPGYYVGKFSEMLERHGLTPAQPPQDAEPAT